MHTVVISGVEKKNDDCRRLHLQKSNKWDASKDVLLVLKRQEHLHTFERPPRQYTKRKPEYWENAIKQKRGKQLSSVQAEKTESQSEACEINEISTTDMSPDDLRKSIKEMGISTRVRNIKKLQEMYINAMEAAARN